MIDIAAIRARLALVQDMDMRPKKVSLDGMELPSVLSLFNYFACGPLVATNLQDEIPPEAIFVSNAPADIAALLAENERLQAEINELRSASPQVIAQSHIGFVQASRDPTYAPAGPSIDVPGGPFLTPMKT